MTVNYMHRTASKCLKPAVADGLIARNVAEAVKAPQPVKKEIHPLTGEQVHDLFDAASEAGDRLEALYVLAVHTGMRQGELLGLRWPDMELDASRLSVRRSLRYVGSGPTYTSTKTGKDRSIDLTPDAAAALRAHRVRQNEERLAAGHRWRDEGLVFPGEYGQPMRGPTLTRGSFKRLKRAANLPDETRFHDLRHTCATLLFGEGVHPKFVRTPLGHATVSITLDIYSHVLPGMGNRTVSAMQAALSQAVPL